jgi:ketol-acid reductoisomerase
MKFLIIGYGSIGKRHAQNLKNILQGKDEIIILRKPGEKEITGFKTFFKFPFFI